MDPSNHKAAEGSQRVEQNPESSESFEVDDIADSENEVKDFFSMCIEKKLEVLIVVVFLFS